MRLPQFATIISVIALAVSSGSLYVSKRSYDLSAAKDERELRDKRPAVDVQVRPTGASSASVVISVINRADTNIAPLDITVEHSFEAGDLYLSSAQQSLDMLQSSLNLKSMGTIAPKGSSTLKATLSGVTDGKWDSLTPGLKLEFTVRIRFGDEQDTVEPISIVRRILAPSADSLQPTPDMFITAVMEAKKARRDQQMYFCAQILLALVTLFSLISYLFRLWQTRSRRTES
jgi:hypothetical protein